MPMFKSVVVVVLPLAALGVWLSRGSLAAEHPEHPSERTQKKQPAEHEKKHDTGKKVEVTKELLGKAVEDYVKKDSDLKGGYFLVFDRKAKAPIALTLEKVHKDKLASLGEGVYFACADFKSTAGPTYDLDIFMKDGKHGLEISEINIHKQDGKERYTWKEESGIWKRQPVAGESERGTPEK